METHIHHIRQQMLDAIDTGLGLRILGGNSKAFYGREVDGSELNMASYAGIISYEPTELFITARAGSSLIEINNILLEQEQMLAFEPALINSDTTIGGVVACGLSGPRRPYSGSVRDFVLGVKCMNGLGKEMSFGGQVMKNVAGYDLSRLMTGALGTLGVILEVSLKVLPLPDYEMTCRKSLSYDDAIKMMNELSTKSLPISAACYDGEYMYLRLSGKQDIVNTILKQLAFDKFDDSEQWWQSLKDYQLPIFKSSKPLWRLSVPSTTRLDLNNDEFLIDWGGAQYWIVSARDPEEMFELAEKAGGSATLFRGGDRNGEIFQPLSNEVKKLHIGLKKAFDPHNVLNPGKMYASI